MSQVSKLYNLLLDYEWHLTPEILEKVYGSEHLGIARIAARVSDVKKKYLVEIESEKAEGTLWKYKMLRPFSERSLFD